MPIFRNQLVETEIFAHFSLLLLANTFFPTVVATVILFRGGGGRHPLFLQNTPLITLCLIFLSFLSRLLCFFTIIFTYHDIAIDVLFILFTANVPFMQHRILLVSQIKIENK